ncbi:MAG: Bll3346 protein [uncultured Solirubrobacteraceae bacterium]|uniref:Bll3346 protein n=1 Tax=uncultured Solirubrobacteraceae bacterium TaxID=1162706 RepID=A0A6J4RWN1_9ACTN|nr:MAG: Bll3346 protein [uncultured Solirubrobacteraceae bacterium]
MVRTTDESWSREDLQSHLIRATPDTVQWGAFDASVAPVERVSSGDIVRIECLAHHAGDAPDLMMDEGVKAVYDGIPREKRGPGVHIVTGPVYVEGARPGDTLECRVLKLEPRLPFGSNFSANWGLLFDEFDQREHVVIYEADVDANVARAVFQYPFPNGPLPYTGFITEPGSVERLPALRNVTIPLRLHMGTAGVAPAEEGPVSTIPPGRHGGNVDNREFLVGTAMYYPVFHEGALFWAGDSHFAQGDGEVNGTGIEAHVNATLQLIVHKDMPITTPLLETPDRWICHGFDEDLDEAVRQAVLETIGFLTRRWEISREEAYSVVGLAGDLRVTQVVDGVKGAHMAIRKDCFRGTPGGEPSAPGHADAAERPHVYPAQRHR